MREEQEQNEIHVLEQKGDHQKGNDTGSRDGKGG